MAGLAPTTRAIAGGIAIAVVVIGRDHCARRKLTFLEHTVFTDQLGRHDQQNHHDRQADDDNGDDNQGDGCTAPPKTTTATTVTKTRAQRTVEHEPDAPRPPLILSDSSM